MLTANYPAEYGRADGGQVRFVTRSGSSDFHGNAFWFFRNSALDANSWTRNRSPNASENQQAGAVPLQPARILDQRSDHLAESVQPESQQAVLLLVGGMDSSSAASRPARGRFQQSGCGTEISASCLTANPITGSAQIIRDPSNGTPFPGNVIPATRQSPNGMALLRAFPLADARIPAGSAELAHDAAFAARQP